MKSLFSRSIVGLASEAAPQSRLAPADRACCCPAQPVVKVLMPPSAGRPHVTELLLCGHHFRVSRDALRTAGATAYDREGQMIMGPGCLDQPAWDHGAAPANENHVPHPANTVR